MLSGFTHWLFLITFQRRIQNPIKHINGVFCSFILEFTSKHYFDIRTAVIKSNRNTYIQLSNQSHCKYTIWKVNNLYYFVLLKHLSIYNGKGNLMHLYLEAEKQLGCILTIKFTGIPCTHFIDLRMEDEKILESPSFGQGIPVFSM